MAELLFRDKNGNEKFLPEAVGKSLGFKVVKSYTPTELQEAAPDGDTQGSPANSLADAVDLILTHAREENPNEDVRAQLDRLADGLGFVAGVSDETATNAIDGIPGVGEAGSAEQGTTEPTEQEQPGKSGKKGAKTADQGESTAPADRPGDTK
ncbi:hypothetical protein DYU11_11575 [Fibrisoma montanum]|uniref:Phage tail protein n=1 Tax=Fibrisoma montanum TaxID=2305895 RepID=A0A418MB81_9BACT|nr:hypothetical protein [Fibrisoma montanum]RIV23614.1 hypothetical protein DYU11_11575 [Fibrisoma montanum]